MEESMYQRLLVVEKRLKEIDELLLDTNLLKDRKAFRDISKERANLEPQAIAFNAFRKNESRLW